MYSLRHQATALWLAMALLPSVAAAAPVVEVAVERLEPAHLAVVINERDPYSVAVGNAYVAAWGIPADNVIRVRFPVQVNMTAKAYNRVSKAVFAANPERVQGYALAWTEPFKVGCMSVTSAFTFGFDEAYCAKGCRATQASRYFDADTRRPFDDLALRPAMNLAAASVADARRLIDRGQRAQHAWPGGTGYLVHTADQRRNVRARGFAAIAERWRGVADVRIVGESSMAGVENILFYFTGTPRVRGLDRNGFVAGAMADHLTSAGGRLTSDKQMSVLRWLEAGASGSYGTVVEPCNITAKFPDPGIAIERYLRGESLLEAYWKSVQMPGQGVFVGDPLVAPFGGARVEATGDGHRLVSHELPEGEYRVAAARRGERFEEVGTVSAMGTRARHLALGETAYDCYRVAPAAAGGPALEGRCR
ncbi:MAG: TIGR03790 family protein [Pseudomonadota bacterium]